MFPHSCHYGFCQTGSVLGYTPTSTGYGADVGYYYTEYLGWYSNLSKVTIIASAPDDAENAGESCPIVAQPVNVTNGNMWLRQTDFALPGRGKRLEINRFYNSIIQTNGIFGRGWSTAYDESLQIYNGNLARLNLPDGRTAYFVRETPNGLFMPHTAGTYAFIEQNTGGGFTLTFKDGEKHQFSVGGSLLSIKDRNANQTTLNYTNNLLTGITDASGRTLTINMSGGLVQSISDSFGTVATYAYYQNTSNLQTVTYQDGAQYKFEYDTTTVAGKTFLKTVKDANNKILETHEFDAQGRATTSEKEGGVEKYIFDYSNWNATSPYTLVKHKKNATDPNFIETKYFFSKSMTRNVVLKTEGNCNCGSGTEVTTFEYDDRLNLKKKREQISANEWRETTFTYNYQGDVLTRNEKVGSTDLGTEKFTYNPFGQVLTYQDKINSATTPATNTLVNEYDTNGNLTTTTDALGNITTITYPATNNRGLPEKVKDARLNETKLKWFSSGLLEEIEDANLKKTNFTYDARGRTKTVTNALTHVMTYNYFDDTQRKVEIVHPDAKKQVYEFDNRRLLDKITDERGEITDYQFDDAYRLIKITDPLGHANEYGYDLMSNMTSSEDALGNVTDYRYDDFDRLREIEYPAAATGATRLKVNYTYDDLGRVKTFSDTAGRLTTHNYLDSQRKNEIINAQNEKTTTEYNERFQTIKVKDALNQEYVFTYDALGRQLTQTRGGATMSYEYDAVGNRTKRTDYTSRETDYVYDNLNRLTNINYVGQTRDDASYIYDNLSRLTSATNYAGTVSFDYDNRSRIEGVIDVFDQKVNYQYDANGNRTKLKFSANVGSVITPGSNNIVLEYVYDAANRLTQMTEGNRIFGFSYDNANRMTGKTLPNGVSSIYNYDGMSRLTQLKHQLSSNNIISDNQYSYNGANQISQIAELAQTKAFTYDNIDRLTNVSLNNSPSENYGFDAVGNRTSSHLSSSYTHQPFNRLTATNDGTYVYDANGNLTSKDINDDETHYVWDFENRLRSADTRNSAVEYKYDALGRRVERTVAGEDAMQFTYDGLDTIFNLDTSDMSGTKYINAPGIDNKLSYQQGANDYYFLQDHLGSTTAIANSSGTITEQTSYDSFGNATNQLSTRFQYTGREYDELTGLHYYRARWYDAQVGRFISEDPIGLRGGINQFGYVSNNASNLADPNGLDGCKKLPNGKCEDVPTTPTGGGEPPRKRPWMISDPPMSPSPTPFATPTSGGTPTPPIAPTPTTPSEPNSSCECETAIPRMPDFYTGGVYLPIPQTGGFLRLGGSFTIDRHGQIYLTTPGASVGFPPGVDASITGGWLLQRCKPTPEQTRDYLTSWGGGLSGFSPWLVGGGVGVSSGGTAVMGGVGVPGGSLNGGYGFQIY